MDSKEILETFGISKNFGIVLFIQSIIVIIGCFLAIQSVYLGDVSGNFIWSFRNFTSLLFFIALLVYSFYAYRKNESYFKWVLYLYGLLLIINMVAEVITGLWISLTFNILLFIVLIYLILNLSNYSKAKIAVLLLVLIEIVHQFYVFIFIPSPVRLLTIIKLIPVVSIALTYFARYNDKGFKILL